MHTDGTNHELQGDEGYENISVFQPLQQTLMPDVRKLRQDLQLSRTDNGDVISSIVVAIEMITAHCKKLKYVKTIYLITNGAGDVDDEDLDGIASKLKEENIKLVVLGVDFDDPEFGFEQSNKSPRKAKNERSLRKLTEECDGVFGTMAEAISDLEIPRIKEVKTVPTFKGILTLGNPEDYDTALSIDVEQYARIMVAKPPTASSYVVRSDANTMQSSATMQDGDANLQDGLAAVKSARTYKVEDPDAPDGKRDVDPEELEKGYEYGRTAVHVSESDRAVTDLPTSAGLDIIGFVPRENFQRYFSLSNAKVIVAQKANEKASLALSSLIHALYELTSYAIARFVSKDNKPPKIVLLAPEIDVDHECLIEIELPFAEDMRNYRFPALDRVITVSGKSIKEHRNLPNNDLMTAMSNYVDSMDLSQFGTDDDGEPAEYASLSDTYSPALHAINQAIRWRAAYAGTSEPPSMDILTKYSKPPKELEKLASSHLEALTKAADVKKVPPRQKGRKRGRDAEKPLSGLDVEELLGNEKRIRISPENAIPEFKQMLAMTEDVNGIKDASRQMADIVQDYIRHSLGDSAYGRAVEAIRVMKEELTELEEPGIFNDFLSGLKEKIRKGELGGDRREMWLKMRNNRLGLIEKKTSDFSKVTEEEAKAVRFSFPFFFFDDLLRWVLIRSNHYQFWSLRP